MGDQEYQTAKKLGELIGRWATLGKTLVIASSDLAHGHSYQDTKQLDEAAASSVVSSDITLRTMIRQASPGRSIQLTNPKYKRQRMRVFSLVRRVRLFLGREKMEN